MDNIQYFFLVHIKMSMYGQRRSDRVIKVTNENQKC